MQPVPTRRERLAAWAMKAGGKQVEADLADAKQKWLAPLRGRVLEIGPGLGTNLPYLQHCNWTGIEPSPAMRHALAQRGVPGPLLAGAAEDIPLPDSSVDAVVGTLVLCSVENPQQAIHEIRRVLKPGGRFVYIEHVAAARITPCYLQHLLRPACYLIGCHPTRNTGQFIAQAGFTQVEQEAWPTPKSWLLPHIAGQAYR